MDKKISLDLAQQFYYLHVPANGHQSLFSSVFAYDAMIQQLNSLQSVSLHGYCLFPDGIHLLIQSHDKPSQWLDPWLMQYNQWHQQVSGDSGYLFNDERKQLVLIQPRYLPKTLKFLHELPISKKLSSHIHQYPYSSHAAYLNIQQSHVNTEHILSILSPHSGQRIRRYEDYMNSDYIKETTKFTQGNHDYYLAFADQAYITRSLSDYADHGDKQDEENYILMWQSCMQAMEKATELDTHTLMGIRRHSILPDAHFILAWLFVEVAKGPLYLAAKQLGLDEITLRLNIKSVRLHHPEAYLRYIAHSWQSISSAA